MLRLNHITKVCSLIKVCIIILLTPLLVSAGYKIPEKNKTVLRTTSDPLQQLRANLYLEYSNGTVALADGILTMYNPAYSNAVDMGDARKLSNFQENIALVRDGQTLAIEKRKPVGSCDTAFLKLWQLQKKTYRLEIVSLNLDHPGLYGYVEDSYLMTTKLIELNATTNLSFTIDNNPGSAATDRFRVVFTNDISQAMGGIVPVRYARLNASRLDASIAINWTVENEINMQQYEVEHAIDGRNFSQIGTIQPGSNSNRGSYTLLDRNPAKGNNFYRIKGTSSNGKIQYSAVVKVMSEKTAGSISVYPNPVRNNLVNLQLTEQPLGKYKVRLLNYLGQQVYAHDIDVNSGNDTYSLQLNQKVAPGYYQLEVTGAGKRMFQQVIIQ